MDALSRLSGTLYSYVFPFDQPDYTYFIQ
jgi:hypothetical protein